MQKRIGSVLHGALGDYYEQILCLKLYKNQHPSHRIIAFFAVSNRYRAFRHFDLSFIDEIYQRDDIGQVPVDAYYQFQIKDRELAELVLDHLPSQEKSKFNHEANILPWHPLREHPFEQVPLSLELSGRGRRHLDVVKEIAGLDEDSLSGKFKVGFLWRYRKKGSINSLGQHSERTVFENINGLVQQLVRQYNAHIVVCGMNLGKLEQLSAYQDIVEEAGLALGERKNTVTPLRFDVDRNVTYLPGAGYAVEMEIMSGCDLLITMPSGFSEPLWMKQRQPVVMIFPPKEYLLRLWKHRMPFFDHSKLRGRLFNTFTFHSPNNVMKHLKKMAYVDKCL